MIKKSVWLDRRFKVLYIKLLIRNRRCLFIFRDGSNQDICVCPDFMTCEDKNSLAMEKENTLHLIYGSGFVIFFIVLISKYIVLLLERLRMSKLVRLNQKPACWSNWYPDFVKVSVQKLEVASKLWITVRRNACPRIVRAFSTELCFEWDGLQYRSVSISSKDFNFYFSLWYSSSSSNWPEFRLETLWDNI